MPQKPTGIDLIFFDHFAPWVEDDVTKPKYPNSAVNVFERVVKEKAAIEQILSRQAGRAIEVRPAQIPTYSETNEALTQILKKNPGDAALIVGAKRSTPHAIGEWESYATNCFHGFPVTPLGELIQNQPLSSELNLKARFLLQNAKLMGDRMRERLPRLQQRSFVLSKDREGAGSGPCNRAFWEALFLRGMSRVIEYGEDKKIETVTVAAPVGLWHIPGFVKEARGVELRKLLVASNPQLGFKEGGIGLGSVEEIVGALKTAIAPVLLEQDSAR